MKTFTSILTITACIGISIGALAQSVGSPPAVIPNSNPNPPAIGGQNNNPSAPTTNGNMPINPASPQMPPTVSSTAPAPGAAGSVNNGTGQLFATLDRSRKGYLNQGDVAPNSYLSSHFQQCDSNHDSRLSQAEVDACLQQMPPGKQ